MNNRPSLRPYQIKAKNEVYQAFRSGTQSVMLQVPTGGGKSVILSAVARDAAERGKRVLFLVHRKELVEQLAMHLHRQGIQPQIIMAGYAYRPFMPFQVASIQTLIRRTLTYAPDLIITDEAHHATADSYQTIYRQYPNARRLGVTATPIRSNGKGFESIYDVLVSGPQISELIQDGFLVPTQIFASPLKFDVSKIRVTGGDYNERDLYAMMHKNMLIANLVSSWRKHADGKRTVVFAINVQHSKDIAQEYVQAGISAAHIDGDTPREVRERILQRFATGQIQVLVNCNIITEGFDVPAIECVQLVRPTQSLALYLQMVGRGLRLSKGKDKAIILDHADCVFKHGFPEQDRVWTLKGVERKQTEIKIRDRKTGHVYDPRELPEHVEDIELIEIQAQNVRLSRMIDFMQKAHEAGIKYGVAWGQFVSAVQKPTMQEIDQFAELAGYAKGWAYHKKIEFGYLREPSAFDKERRAYFANQRRQAV